MLVGHGKVYDADLNKEAEGCHGNLNRVLCLSNEVIANRCQWNRKNSGVRTLLLEHKIMLSSVY